MFGSQFCDSEENSDSEPGVNNEANISVRIFDTVYSNKGAGGTKGMSMPQFEHREGTVHLLRKRILKIHSLTDSADAAPWGTKIITGICE